MQDSPSDRSKRFVPAKIMSRRTIVSLTAKLAGGAVLSVIAGTRLTQDAAAQDDEIILTAAASEVGARPGSAYANGYAARAAADQDAGAMTEGATSPSGGLPGGGAPEAPSGGGGTETPSGGGDTSEAEGTGRASTGRG
jgi:hypothetical protein